jgi:DNA-binding NarL/FixJ family response regulator
MNQSGAIQKVKIAIVDDHPLVCEGLAAILSRQSDMEFCGEAAAPADAIRLITASEPDLAIVDLSFQDGSGFDLIRRIRQQCPKVRVLVYSFHHELFFAVRVLEAGALGYLNKETGREELLDALRRAMRGEIVLSRSMQRWMLSQTLPGADPQAGRPSLDALSNRELEIFSLLGQAQDRRAIAARLHLSPKTVDAHLQNSRRKFKARSNAELTYHAIHHVLQR